MNYTSFAFFCLCTFETVIETRDQENEARDVQFSSLLSVNIQMAYEIRRLNLFVDAHLAKENLARSQRFRSSSRALADSYFSQQKIFVGEESNLDAYHSFGVLSKRLWRLLRDEQVALRAYAMLAEQVHILFRLLVSSFSPDARILRTKGWVGMEETFCLVVCIYIHTLSCFLFA